MNQAKIGLIGTGIMGAPMGRNLLQAGYELHVHSRTRAKADELVAQGAKWCTSPADLAKNVEVVISVVSDSPDVEAVYLNSDGVINGIKPGTLCIDMSTVQAEVARRVARELATRKCAFLDAPVSGGKTGAEAGELAIMVGGEEVDLERARPVFDVLGKSTIHCGPVGNGQLTKMCNQILCGLNLLGVCEAVVTAAKVGLDPSVMLKAVSEGAAGSWALNNLGTRMINRDFAPMFMIDLQQKDLRIATQTAGANDIPLPGTAMVSQLLAANQAAGEGREGTQALLKTLERLAGVPEQRTS